MGGLDRSPEERARIRPLGQALPVLRDNPNQCRKDLADACKHELKECDIEAKWPIGAEEVKITRSSWRGELQVVHKEPTTGVWTSAEDKDLKEYMPEVWYNLYTMLKAEREL